MSDAMQALYAGDERASELLAPDGELSIFDAAAFGRAERVHRLLAADPAHATARSEDGFTPLHLAVFGRQKATVRALIEHGADVNALSSGSIARVPPLGTSAFVRSVSMARLLLDAGADVNGRGEGGFTALHAAAQNGDEELIRLLLERGADPELATDDDRRPADLAANDAIRSLL
jgi:uncharacterized protein